MKDLSYLDTALESICAKQRMAGSPVCRMRFASEEIR